MQTPTQITPRPDAHATARTIAANPTADQPASLRLLAWAVLKAERGQPIIQSQLRGVA